MCLASSNRNVVRNISSSRRPSRAIARTSGSRSSVTASSPPRNAAVSWRSAFASIPVHRFPVVAIPGEVEVRGVPDTQPLRLLEQPHRERIDPQHGGLGVLVGDGCAHPASLVTFVDGRPHRGAPRRSHAGARAGIVPESWPASQSGSRARSRPAPEARFAAGQRGRAKRDPYGGGRGTGRFLARHTGRRSRHSATSPPARPSLPNAPDSFEQIFSEIATLDCCSSRP